MEKVKVVKAIPGILKVGDIMVSPAAGEDFVLSETDITVGGSSERWVSLDYVTVSENIPAFFTVEVDEQPFSECYFCGACDDCDCVTSAEELNDLGIELGPEMVVRTEEEIQARYDFFARQFDKSIPGSESQVVYKNLMWFIEWLRGETELLA